MNRPHLHGGASAPAVAELDADTRIPAARDRDGTGAVLTCPGHDNRVRWAQGERFHDLFAARFRDRGAATAVEREDDAITFAELDAMANRLARFLLAQRILPGDRVGLLFDRSPSAYAAMLAVSRIGAAWVPLDRGFPLDRIAFIAEDAGLAVALTEGDLADCLSEAACRVIRLDRVAERVLAERDSPPELPVMPTDGLAYIIYTSGSTGRPKGVAVNHSGICNFIRIAAEVYGIQPGARVYQGMTIAFDFSFEEIWIPLYVGATLVPAPAGGALLGEELACFLRDRHITAICCVPTLLATLEDEALPELDFLLVSGEACPANLIERWHRPDRTFLNVYGPTEATVTCTWARSAPGQAVTIGRPLPSYTIVILDETRKRLLPQGATGEIAVAGIGVAAGYVNRPDKTEAAFIADFLGLGNNPGGRLYCTGDLGRITPNGEIEYMGRIDTQVKIRGYRIELSEIESVLMSLPGMRQAVVEPWQAAPGLTELVAYYTRIPGETALDTDAIAAALAEKLPPWMRPAYLEPMDALPMLPSHKVDRKKLPPPSHDRRGAHSSHHVAPQTPTEVALATTLAGILGLDAVSVEDHFIDELGANSLLLSRFCAALRRGDPGLRVSMKDVYLHPTIRGLAGLLGEAAPDEHPVRAPDRRAGFTRMQAVMTGAVQLGFALLYGAAMIWMGFFAIDWTFKATTLSGIYWHSVAATLALLLFAWSLPIAAKWLLVGRMRETRYKVYSWKYIGLWIVKALIRTNPMNLYTGTPLYNVYLNLMGARVALSAVVMGTQHVMPDLLRIGRRAVVSREVDAGGYRVDGGEVVTGRIEIGDDAFVGVGARLDIGTRIEAGGELGHASALYEGQVIPAGEAWHGVPARPTQTRFRRVPHGDPSALRMWCYNAVGLLPAILVFGPLVMAVMHFVYDTERNSPLAGPPKLIDFGALWPLLPEIVGIAAALVLLGIVLSLAVATILPRIARLFLEPGVTYPLYGFRHWLIRGTKGWSNRRYLNQLFGDSVFITRYLGAIGYRFDKLFQTGSNFGVDQRQDYPFLCHFGWKAMVSDGLVMANAEYSGQGVRLGEIRFDDKCYLGNVIHAVPGGTVGKNVLIGTKTTIPLEGPPREDTGILGAPAFAIPRSVERDLRLTRHETDESFRRARLAAKTRHNLVTIACFLALGTVQVALALALLYGLAVAGGAWSPLTIAAIGIVAFFASVAIAVLVERASIGFGRLKPEYCSIYDPGFWFVERYWKLSVSLAFAAFDGTPFRPLLYRLLGMKIGRGVFDDGSRISEVTLVEIGDNVTLNRGVYVQGHSLEDGVFKSENITIGAGVTVSPHAFVHYGVTVQDGAWIATDSFVMKGETVDAGAWWQGNPASTRLAAAPAEAAGRRVPPAPAATARAASG